MVSPLIPTSQHSTPSPSVTSAGVQEASPGAGPQQETPQALMPPLQIGEVVCDPPVVLAPMAAITNPPYRLLCRDMGAGLVVTEMFHASVLVKKKARNLRMLDIREDEHPVSVQIYGKDPETMARAAETVQWAGADMVDINMGCPMKKVVSSGHGAALLRTPDKIYEIVKAMADAVDIPVTAKIRAGWEDTNATEVGQAVQAAGGAALTIHGRTREEMFEGHPDLDVIKDVKAAIDIPVIGNGDVRDAPSAFNMMNHTGCDGVMIARGCMGYPWVFRELKAAFYGMPIPAPPSLNDRYLLIREHVRLYIETYGVRLTTRQIRKHLLWYFKKTPGEQELKKHLQEIKTEEDIHAALDAAVAVCAQQEGQFEYPRGLRKHPNRRSPKKPTPCTS